MEIDQEFPAGEEAIATNPEYSTLYAIQVVHGRFKEGEAAIAKSSQCSYLYARDVVGGAWEPGEKAIYSSSMYKARYKEFLKEKEEEDT